MARFNYTAHDIDGKEKSGSVTAADTAAATAQLRAKGLFPSNISPAENRGKKSRGIGLNTDIRLPAALSTVPQKQLMIFTRQLATLIQAGMPLLRGLRILERQQSNPALQKALGEIAEALESGSAFAEALAAHPRIFNRLYVNMVKAGEAGGVVVTVLQRLGAYMEKAQKVRNKVQSAMTYPAVVLAASVSILIFLMAAIIPRFETIFADMLDGRTLPPLTLMVMEFSAQLKERWPLLFCGLLLLLIFIALLKRFPKGRHALDTFKLSFPLFGNLARQALLARLARTLGTLLESGVPMIDALGIARHTLNNTVAIRAVEEIIDRVQIGDPVSAPVTDHSLFPPVFAGMIEVGEETGELPGMLLSMADLFEDEVDHAVAALSSIIEPLLIILLALVVGTIVIAMFLPMVSIIGNLS